MFEKIGPQFIQDKERDISLEVQDLHSFLYKKAGQILEISSEPLKDGANRYSVCFYLSEKEAWDSPEGKPLSAEEKDCIRADIIQGVSLMGLEAEVE